MLIEEKIKLLEKLLPQKKWILLDYVLFSDGEYIWYKNIVEKWKQSITRKQKIPTQFYLHIPFCSKKCNYCMYDTIVLKDKNFIDKYIDDIISFLENFKEIFSDTFFNWIYVGWWTPSLLSTNQINKLFWYIFSNFKFDKDYYNTIELNPVSTTVEKLLILKQIWFDRISFWVQSFNKEILDIENRTYVSEWKILEYVNYAKSIWFLDVNIDIILWLNKENENGFKYTLSKLKTILPDSITVYTILKDKEKSIFYKEDSELFYKKIKDVYNNALKETWIIDLYDSSSDSHVLWFSLNKKELHNRKNIYEAHNSNLESLFWVWYKSFWKILWVGTYDTMLFEKSWYKFKFNQINEEQEMLSYILKEFQYKINKKDFEQKFSFKIEEKFWSEIDYLVNNNIITNNKKYITYIWDENYIGYYWLIFLDLLNLVKFIKYRFYWKKQ